MPLDPKTIEALFAPGASVRVFETPYRGPSPLRGVPRPELSGPRPECRGPRPHTRRPRPHLHGINRRGREYHGRTVRKWCRLWGLDVSNIDIAMLWEGRLRWHFNKRQGKPEQFLTHARQKGWIQ